MHLLELALIGSGDELSPARPSLIRSNVAIILAVTAGFCSRVCTVVNTLTRLVTAARAAISICKSSE